MTDPSKRLAVLGVVLATFIAAPAGADEKNPAAATKPAEKPADAKVKAAENKADRAEAKAERAEVKAEKAEDKAEKLEGKLADAKQDAAKARAEFRSAIADLRLELREGKIKKEELNDRLAKLRGNMKERRKEHREAIKERWGDALAKPSAVQELKHHARRVAYLNRALLLSETERTGKAKDKLVERIEKLIEKENDRHEAAMDRIKSGQAPVAAATTSAGGTSTAAAPAKGTAETAPAKGTATAPAAAPANPGGPAKGGDK